MGKLQLSKLLKLYIKQHQDLLDCKKNRSQLQSNPTEQMFMICPHALSFTLLTYNYGNIFGILK